MSFLKEKDMKNKISKLESKVSDLTKKVEELEKVQKAQTTPQHICIPHKTMFATKMNKKGDMYKVPVGYKCRCGKHIEEYCNHVCEMYQCFNKVKCDVTFCRECVELNALQERLDAQKVKCIRCYNGGSVANARFGGKFCSKHCQDMCALYDY